MRKIPFAGVELTSQRVRGLRGTSELPGRPECVFLPIYSGHQVRWTYQPGSHRRKVTQDFSCTFLLRYVPKFFSREGFSSSFPSSAVKSNFVCVFVCFLCFLPIHSGRQWTYQPGSHRISHPPSFCGACLNFSREKDSAIPFPRRP